MRRFLPTCLSIALLLAFAAPSRAADQNTPPAHVQTAVLAGSLVVKAGPGNLYGFEVVADSTLSGAAWWIMIFDATAAPADGAVTPAKCYALPSGATGFSGGFTIAGVAFTTGITIVTSTTGCFSKTVSAHAFIAGDVQ